jgi:hypothetical protein
MASRLEKCAHPSCLCLVKEGEKYCSTFCEGEAKTADIVCLCGHSECGGTRTHER